MKCLRFKASIKGADKKKNLSWDIKNQNDGVDSQYSHKINISFQIKLYFYRLLCNWCKWATAAWSNSSDPTAQGPVICWTEETKQSFLSRRYLYVELDALLWFTVDGRSRVDYGLADVWLYKWACNAGSDSLKEKKRRKRGVWKLDKKMDCREKKTSSIVIVKTKTHF